MPPLPMLVSHHLCPYVQRAAIVAAERGIALERTYIDLNAKPDWFLALSPTGKVPLLQLIDNDGVQHVLFESAAIAEYLDETGEGTALMPGNAIDRARTRAWVEYASGTLADIAGLYSATAETAFDIRVRSLTERFVKIEGEFVGPWLRGQHFGLVDAAFGPVFRYLDAFEHLADLALSVQLPRLAAWRSALAARPSVANAVASDYPEQLARFLRAKSSVLSKRIGT